MLLVMQEQLPSKMQRLQAQMILKTSLHKGKLLQMALVTLCKSLCRPAKTSLNKP